MSLPSNRNITSWSELNREIEVIYRTLTKSQSTAVINSQVTVSAGAGSSAKDANRAGVKLLAVGSNFVAFTSDIGTSQYNLTLWAYDTSGYNIGFSKSDITSTTSNGFTINASQVMILEWIAVPYK
jgi:hypothetical protein